MPISYQEAQLSISKDDLALTGIISEDLFLANEEYGINVVARLSEDEINFEIGNFDVEVSIIYENQKKVTLKNMGMLKYYSQLSRIARAIIKMPLILFGLIDESQDVKIDFHHTVKNSEAFKEILVRISPPSLRVYSVIISFEVRLKGLRNFMQNYFYIGFCIGSSLIFLSLFSIFLVLFSINAKIPEEKPTPDFIVPLENLTESAADFSMIIKKPTFSIYNPKYYFN